MKLLSIIFLFPILCFGQGSVTVKPSGSYPGSLTGAFKRVYNVLTYGAVADGVTDSRAAIQAAINACNAAKDGQVYFPGGTYISVGTLISYTNVTLVGDGLVSTFIRSGNADTLIAIYNLADALAGVPYSSNANTLMQDIHLNGHGVGTIGFYINRAANFYIGRHWVDSFTSIGTYLHNSLIGKVDQGYYKGNPTGIYAYADGSNGTATTLVKLTGCTFYSATTWGVNWVGGGMLKIEHSDFAGNGTINDTLTGSIYYHDNPWPGGLYLDQVWWEQNLGTNVAIANNVSFQGGLNYPLETTHSIMNCQDLGSVYGFGNRNVYLKGNYQRLGIINSTLTGCVKSIISDGNSTTNINVFGSVLTTNTIRGGSVLTTTGQ